MAVYVVMEPPGRAPDAAATTFVRDGFSWVAFLVPPLWLLWHRLWIEAVLAFAVIGFLSALSEASGFMLASPLLTFLVMLFIGLEGPALRISALIRRGWKQWGVVVADGLDDADARYALDTGVVLHEHAPEPSIVPDPAFARTAQQASFGLVSFSGRH